MVGERTDENCEQHQHGNNIFSCIGSGCAVTIRKETSNTCRLDYIKILISWHTIFNPNVLCIVF